MPSGTQPIWKKEISSADVAPPKTPEFGKNVNGLDFDSDNPSMEKHYETLSQFSDISRKFIDSYSLLEQKIDQLSTDLAAQTAEKEQQYEERNRLAERLEKILSTLPSAVVVIDGHGIIQESNALAEDMLGSNLMGETWLNIISRAFAPQSDDGYEISLKDGRRVKVETKALGSEPGQIVLLTDLTETRKLQEEQSREQRLSVIGKMMASLAHQIRTPLSSALLYSGHILSQKLDGKRQQRIHLNLQHSLQQLERQVSDMLLFASGGVSSKQRFQLQELINTINVDINRHIIKKEAVIEIDNCLQNRSHLDVTLFGNMQALLGAIANLIENSLHACRHNIKHNKLVHIIIGLELDEQNNICISVSDNGCGISEDEKQQIFQPFYTSHARGTGLGLAVVNTVVSSFNGDITIESEMNEGTTITLVIPCIVSETFPVEKTDGKPSTSVTQLEQLAGD